MSFKVQEKSLIETGVDFVYETADEFWDNFTPFDNYLQLLYFTLALCTYSLAASYLDWVAGYGISLVYMIIFFLPFFTVPQSQWMNIGLTDTYKHAFSTRILLAVLVFITCFSQHLGEEYNHNILNCVISFGYPMAGIALIWSIKLQSEQSMTQYSRIPQKDHYD